MHLQREKSKEERWHGSVCASEKELVRPALGAWNLRGQKDILIESFMEMMF